MEFKLEITSTEMHNGNLTSLKEYTFTNGKKFPKSYIDFVRKYGYGLSCNLFIIYIPMDDYPDSFFIRSKEIISTYQDVLENEEELWFELEPDLKYENLKNLIPFGMSENGHYLFWDIKCDNLSEFDIYITDFRGQGFTKVAKNLYEFFDLVTSEINFKKALPFREKPLPKIFKSLQKLQ